MIKRVSCFLLWTALSFPVWSDAESPTLSVRGEAQLQVPPDQVSISLGVVSEAKVAQEALSANSESVANVIASLEKLGLSEKDYETQQFSISPIWSSRPRVADSNWQSKIIGYRVNNTVRAKTSRLATIGEIINTATEAGANHIQSIVFGLSEPRRYRRQAIAMAVKNAQEDAQALASASGNQLQGTLSIQLNNAVASQKSVNAEFIARSAGLAQSAPPIDSGDVSVSASVSIIYLLAE